MAQVGATCLAPARLPARPRLSHRSPAEGAASLAPLPSPAFRSLSGLAAPVHLPGPCSSTRLALPLLVSSRLPRARHRPRRTPARTRACKRRPPYGRTAARLARPRIPGHSALREERAISLPERSAGVGTDEGDFERRPARGTPERGTLRGRARGPCLLGHAVQRPGRLRRASRSHGTSAPQRARPAADLRRPAAARRKRILNLLRFAVLLVIHLCLYMFMELQTYFIYISYLWTFERPPEFLISTLNY